MLRWHLPRLQVLFAGKLHHGWPRSAWVVTVRPWVHIRIYKISSSCNMIILCITVTICNYHFYSFLIKIMKYQNHLMYTFAAIMTSDCFCLIIAATMATMCSLATKINPPSYLFHSLGSATGRTSKSRSLKMVAACIPWSWRVKKPQLPRIDLETGYRIQNGFAWIYCRWYFRWTGNQRRFCGWFKSVGFMGLEHGISACPLSDFKGWINPIKKQVQGRHVVK